MTEKEKAKAYDEALARAKELYSQHCAEWRDEDIEYIFPELAESEGESGDEKIRKAIIEGLREMKSSFHTISSIKIDDAIAWLEKQADKDKLIKELGEYKVKYTQEVLENHINSMSNKDNERLRKTTIAFLKDFAEQGYENAVECIDWLEKQGETFPVLSNSSNIGKESIRPQSQWKPSDEQMRILDLAIRGGINHGTREETTLVSLYEDLKKLKKEE